MVRILAAGCAVIDFVFGVDALPQTFEKHRATGFQTVGGGAAANAAVAAARLGAEVSLCARVGDDSAGRMILDGLEADGVDCAPSIIAPGGRSAASSVFVDPSGERMIMNFRGDGLPDAPPPITGCYDAVLVDTRWLEGAQSALIYAQNNGIPGVLDAEAPVQLELASLASHAAFSRQGLAEFSGTGDLIAGLTAAAVRLPGAVIVTDGAAGSFAMTTQDPNPLHIQAFLVDPVDTLGAGDVWHGAFAVCLAGGASLPESMRWANAAAALKCRRAGGRSGPTLAELTTFLQETT